MRQTDRVAQAKRAKTKTLTKTRKGLPAHLTPGNPGNSGGKPGRSGRLPQPFALFIGKLRCDPEFHAALEKASRDPESRGFSSALKMVSDYDTEKPAEKHQIVGPVEVRVSFAREGRRTTSS